MYGNGYASTIKVRGETKSEREREIQNRENKDTYNIATRETYSIKP